MGECYHNIYIYIYIYYIIFIYIGEVVIGEEDGGRMQLFFESLKQIVQPFILRLLALLAQKYKYWYNTAFSSFFGEFETYCAAVCSQVNPNFTCFTSTKVKVLIRAELMQALQS